MLLGTWTIEDDGISSVITFHDDGTFEAQVREGERQQWQFKGSWVLAGKWLHYKYSQSNFAAIPPGTKDRDELINVGEKQLVLGSESAREVYRRVPDR